MAGSTTTTTTTTHMHACTRISPPLIPPHHHHHPTHASSIGTGSPTRTSSGRPSTTARRRATPSWPAPTPRSGRQAGMCVPCTCHRRGSLLFVLQCTRWPLALSRGGGRAGLARPFSWCRSLCACALHSIPNALRIITHTPTKRWLNKRRRWRTFCWTRRASSACGRSSSGAFRASGGGVPSWVGEGSVPVDGSRPTL